MPSATNKKPKSKMCEVARKARRKDGPLQAGQFGRHASRCTTTGRRMGTRMSLAKMPQGRV